MEPSFSIQKYQITQLSLGDLESIGEQKQSITVLLQQTENEQVHHSLLQKILQAVKVNWPDDIHCFHLDPDQQVTILPYLTDHPVNTILVFGISPGLIGLQIELIKYTPRRIRNTQFLFADSLGEIANNQPLKKLLWTALKHIFNP